MNRNVTKLIGVGAMTFSVGILLVWLLPPIVMVLVETVALALCGFLLFSSRKCR